MKWTDKKIKTKLQKNYGWDWQELAELARAIGYKCQRQAGSHRIFKHPHDRNNLVIPTNEDLRRTDCNIISQLKNTYFKTHPYHDKKEILTSRLITVPVEEIPVVEEAIVIPKIDWFEFVKNTRKNSAYSQYETGGYLGIHGTTYGNVELGKRKFTENEYFKWCELFNLNPLDYVEYIPLNSPTPGKKNTEDKMISKQEKTILAPKSKPTPEDIIGSIKMKLARLEELKDILENYSKLNAEYEELLEELSRAGTL